MPATDFRVQVGYRKHWKTIRLVRRCGRVAIDCHLAIWEYAAVNRPDGRMTGLSVTDIEDIAEWEGEPGVFVQAMLEIRYLDRQEDGTLVIHDWPVHQPYIFKGPERSDSAKNAADARWKKEKNQPGKRKNAKRMRTASEEHRDGIRGASVPHAPTDRTDQPTEQESVAVPSQVPEGPTEIPTATNSPSGEQAETATAEPPPNTADELDGFELPDDFPTEAPPTVEPSGQDPRLADIDDSHQARVFAEGVLNVTQDLARKRGNESIWSDLNQFVPIGTWGVQMRPVIRAPRAAAERVLAWLGRQVNQSAADSMRKRLLIVEDEAR